jgi:hypothetical protein
LGTPANGTLAKKAAEFRIVDAAYIGYKLIGDESATVKDGKLYRYV